MTSISPSRNALFGDRKQGGPLEIGVFPGEGSSPELVAAAMRLVESVVSHSGLDLNVVVGGAIGLDARRATGADLPDEAAELVGRVFARGGAILAGAGGGRFVYDMRKRFGLGLKLNPIRSFPSVTPSNFDVLVVRETSEGLYEGASREEGSGADLRITHEVVATEGTTRSFLDAAARIAAARTGRLAVACKGAGIPAITDMWRAAADHAARRHGVAVEHLEIDFAAYRLVRNPASFDVLAAANCFGDILSDLGGLLMGSRGVTYGGAFSSEGFAAYQTNHGAAYDLAGAGRANPVGQMFAATMMLRESFGLEHEADCIERAIGRVWSAGWTTFDMIHAAGSLHVCSTLEFTERVQEALGTLMNGE
jgi:3-isopropylmalate dehydrogenase